MWNQSNYNLIVAGEELNRKFRRCIQQLTQWSRQKYGNLDKQITALRDQLTSFKTCSAMQRNVDVGPVKGVERELDNLLQLD